MIGRGIRFIGDDDDGLSCLLSSMAGVAMIGGKYEDSDGTWRFSFNDGAHTEVSNHRKVLGDSQSTVVADAGGKLDWPPETRLAHYKFGALVELCVIICKMTDLKHSSEKHFQTWFMELLSGLCKALFSDYMEMGFVKVVREKPETHQQYDLFVTLRKDSESAGLYLMIELKFLKDMGKYNSYADGDMHTRLSNLDSGGMLLGDGYLVNKSPYRDGADPSVKWDRYSSCVREVGIKRYSMLATWGESEATIQRMGKILAELVPRNVSGTPDEVLHPEPDLHRRNLCLDNMQTFIFNALAWNKKTADGVRKTKLLVSQLESIGATLRGIHVRDLPNEAGSKRIRGGDDDGGVARGAAAAADHGDDGDKDDDDDGSNQDWTGLPEYFNVPPDFVEEKIDLRVPVDRRLGANVVREVIEGAISIDYPDDGDDSEMKLSNWQAGYAKLDIAERALIGKIGLLKSRGDDKQIREEYWAQIRPYDEVVKEANFDSKNHYFPRIPVARMMWYALTYPEGNKWQRVIERFRETVLAGSVKPVEGKTDLVTFDRNVSNQNLPPGAILYDHETEHGWNELDFPDEDDQGTTFNVTAPAYLLGELLVSGKEHVKGHGWRFANVPVDKRPWGGNGQVVAGGAMMDVDDEENDPQTVHAENVKRLGEIHAQNLDILGEKLKIVQAMQDTRSCWGNMCVFFRLRPEKDTKTQNAILGDFGVVDKKFEEALRLIQDFEWEDLLNKIAEAASDLILTPKGGDIHAQMETIDEGAKTINEMVRKTIEEYDKALDGARKLLDEYQTVHPKTWLDNRKRHEGLWQIALEKYNTIQAAANAVSESLVKIHRLADEMTPKGAILAPDSLAAALKLPR
jgi:hypothetical protein